MSSATANGGNRDRNGHVLVWEQPGLDEPDNRPPQKQAAMVGSRHVVAFMLFLGMANAYVMRTNMSVAIVAMVNHTALPQDNDTETDECDGTYNSSSSTSSDGEFVWSTSLQGYILSSFFYGYVLTQIPFGILAKRYGAKYFLGIGMLINSVFGLLVPVAAQQSYWLLILVRFIQGLGEGPIVPCTHALLAKWIPPNERSRMGAFVYAGAQFGTVVSMPLSGLLSEYGFSGGWPSIFYVFGLVGTIWSIAFIFTVYEDPECHPSIAEDEKKYILSSVWGSAGVSSPPVPWKSILTSLPFWAILIAHMGQNYGYETLMTELPTFMKQILHFDIKSNGTVSALPYLAMWIFSMLISHVADWMISNNICSHQVTRKILNTIGQFGPAIALVAASYTGCNPTLTVAILTIGVGLNGGIYSGFKVNHLDISPRFAGILMSFTNCLANLAGLLAPMTAGYIIESKPTQAQWRIVFVISAVVYIACGTFYLLFASGVRQPWDNPEKDKPKRVKKDIEGAQALNETRH
ncbi:putative inorganic phosphate cotransporter isoform X1 [Neodiprion pinetum]|uniref:Putative inorganic phosphate cotransporter n=1 Tax=Neodiprion lecontei TaxID=441921 RepID=A0A6J0C6R2_NEOLC|nr:putative inorganic phosphate cotransporter isoform X1 [Neodiprion lecontei]XP_046427593.1 putative inorganic phosphate cotransporter isoform X1 [Neodiprion fabricii]XP_046485990.1 putative inorganic phosphate cotransporter isoform X1 [Neodiprion pinetum]XP_046621528.1 putative inorganic phosphate cotransporter isoform X1 [Neodiprion virginianus]